MEVTLSLILVSKDVKLQIPGYTKNDPKNDLVLKICLTFRLETTKWDYKMCCEIHETDQRLDVIEKNSILFTVQGKLYSLGYYGSSL